MAIGVAVTGIIILAVVVTAVMHQGDPAGTQSGRSGAAPGPVPRGAVSAVHALSLENRRVALTPALNTVLHPGRLFPRGASLRIVPGSWRRAGAYANVKAELRIPGRPRALVEVGLVQDGRHWHVTFEAAK